MRRRLAVSIRTALTLIIGTAAVVPLIIVMMVADGYLSRLLATSVDNYTQLLAASSRDQISIGLASIRTRIQQAAFLGGKTDFAGFREVLSDTKLPNRFFQHFIWISPEGTAEDAVLAREMSPRSRDILGNDLWNVDIVRRVLLEKVPVWSDTTVLVPDGGPTLSLAVPLPAGGALMGIASLDRIDRLVQTGQHGEARILLMDRRGVMFRSGDPERDSERNNLADIGLIRSVIGGLPEVAGSFTYDGRFWVGSAMRIPETGWIIVVARDAKAAQLPLESFHRTAQATFAGGVVCAILFAAWAGRRLTKPINAIVVEARLVAAGRYDSIVGDTEAEYVELRELARVFRFMVSEVARRERALEETRDDLRRLNEGLESAVEARTLVLRQQAEMLTRTEAEAKAAEARMRTVIDSLDSAVFVYDWSGMLVATNRPARILLAGHDGSALFDDSRSGAPTHFAIASALVTAGLLPRDVAWAFDVRMTGSWEIQTPEGRHVLIKRFKADSAYLTEQFIDVTDLRHVQSQLEQSERLASLGGLVAGFAHEINTPLGISVTAATQMFDHFTDFERRFHGDGLRLSDIEGLCDSMKEGREILVSNLDRAARLMRSFKQVSADQTSGDVRAIDLGAYVSSVLESLTPEIRRSRHTVELKAAARIDIVTSPGAIAQIVTNLVLNALRHAFPDDRSGTVTVTVDRDSQGMVLLRVADDGAGVSAEVRARMFEPFFTTCRGAGGTGLGLSIVHNLAVSVLGGAIASESSLGHGLAITIRFPGRLVVSGGEPVSGAAGADGSGESDFKGAS